MQIPRFSFSGGHRKSCSTKQKQKSLRNITENSQGKGHERVMHSNCIHTICTGNHYTKRCLRSAILRVAQLAATDRRNA